MKRVILLLIVLIMTMGVSSCNKDDNGKPLPTNTVAPTNTPVVTEEPTPTAEPTAIPKPEPGVNVALGKYYDVSSETDSTYIQWGWSSEFINDGIKEDNAESQGWTTNTKETMTMDEWEDHWVLIDLAQIISIDKVMLYPRQDTGINFPSDYFIEVSTDNKEFKTVATKIGDVKEGDEKFEPSTLTFDAVDAKYVRLVITKPAPEPDPADGHLVQLAEFEIYSASSDND